MKKVRFGIVGLGNMGSAHARNIVKDNNRDFSLGAVCDIVPDKAETLGEELDIPHFTDAEAMYDSGEIDAVIVATPHYWHGPLTIQAVRRKLHVLCEKPIESRVSVARAMIAECRRKKVVLGGMLQHRARGIMIKARQLVQSGRLGEIFRIQLICSSWFRTQAYYDSGAWRGTWDGEGGGVLINQAPHHLDLFQWIGGMPRKVTAIVDTRAHDIEVEDAANVICEYGDGKIGYIYATTAEEPGMEQLMISGDKGTMVVEKGTIRLGKLKIPVSKHIMQSKKAAAGGAEQDLKWSEVRYPARKNKTGHIEIIRGFVKQVLTGEGLYAGDDMLNELELSNAAYLAGFKGKTVELPVEDREIDALIRKLERERSTGKGGGLRKEADKVLRGLLK